MKEKNKIRFVSNVKFTVPNELVDSFKNLILETLENKTVFPDKHSLDSFYITDDMYFYYNDTRNVFMLYPNSDASLFDWGKLKEVSIYEAIPELIPDGMRYNKELDKLVPDVVSVAYEYCSGIKVEFEKVVDYVDQKENISCKNEKSKHYEIWKDFEAIDVLKNCLTRDEFIGFLKGNILKYQLRLGKKDDVSKEIEKIKDYQNELNFILKELEKNAK